MRSVKIIRLSSLGLKVLLAYLISALVFIALAVAAALWAVDIDAVARFELEERAVSLASKLQLSNDGKSAFPSLTGEHDWMYDSLPEETAYRVLDASGAIVHISRAGADFWPLSSLMQVTGEFSFEKNGTTMYGFSLPFEHHGQRWLLQHAASGRLSKILQHTFALPYFGIAIGIISALLIVGFALCAYVTLHFALKPVQEISKKAASISSRSLHERLEAQAVPLEISPLVNSFNSALDRIENGYRLQQEFLARAAHELKTPLALIRAQIELSGETGRIELLSDVEYMTRQVQQLLLLAEASEVHNYVFADVRLEDVARQAVDYLSRMANSRGVRVVVTPLTLNVVWHADSGAFFTLLKNLLENAIQHAPSNTEVVLEIQQNRISVRDFGAGVDAKQLPLLFQRFWRGAHRRDSGAGLGLSICQEISLAHGWQLSAEHANPGLRFLLGQELNFKSPARVGLV